MGQLVVIISPKAYDCTPTAIVLPDWAIGVTVAGSVALAGGAVGIGLGIRKHLLNKEMKKI